MDKCQKCGTPLNNGTYLIEDDPNFFTHCYGCQHEILKEKEKNNGN